jgi:signal transduction histidine kinase
VRAGRRTGWLFAFLSAVLVLQNSLLFGPPGEPLVLKAVGPVAWLLLPTALGSVTRLRRAYLEAVRARAEHAERTREEEARHRVAEERMRIARDLHDVVAHHLALANAQAGTAAHLMRTHPEQATKIVAEIAGTTSSALRELKATVGLLRHTDEDEPSLQPATDLDQIPDLASSFASAGLTVTVTTQGRPRRPSPGVALTAYRIVQEALTNVAKHAATQRAEVQITYSHDRLAITITDAGHGPSPSPSPPPPGSGYGLIGMRERALSVGGRLRTGPHPAGGFEVVTELPLHPHLPQDREERTA